MFRHCSKCNVTKLKTEFYNSETSLNCKTCSKKTVKITKKKNLHYVQQQFKQFEDDFYHLIHSIDVSLNNLLDEIKWIHNKLEA